MRTILFLFICIASSFGQIGSAIDPRINGVQDDGSAEGVVKSKITRGNLVKMPFVDSRYVTDNIAAGAVAAYNGGGGQSNPDGTATLLFVSVPASGAIRVMQTFYGTVFGLRWIRGTVDFGVIIDGVAYRVSSRLNEPEAGTAISATAEFENLTIIADDLPDAPHVAEIVFVNTTGSTISWNLYGYLVEARAGHGAIPRAAGVVDAATVPSSDTAIVNSNFKTVRKVFYWNTDTVTRTVTIKQNSLTITVLTLPTLTGATFDLGDFVALNRATGASGFSHVCDLAAKVNFLPIGGL